MSETRQFILFLLCLSAALCSFYSMANAFKAKLACDAALSERQQ